MEETEVYIGNLPPDTRTRDVVELVSKYGNAVSVSLKDPKVVPAYAFVVFKDPKDAANCIAKCDGVKLKGYRICAEYTRHNGRWSFRRSKYRVRVSGLPASGSWQDLRDFMRGCVGVGFAEIQTEVTGFVEFSSYDDMKFAIGKLNNTEFTSNEGETSYVTVKEEEEGKGSRERSRSERSRSSSTRSGSKSRSPRSRRS